MENQPYLFKDAKLEEKEREAIVAIVPNEPSIKETTKAALNKLGHTTITYIQVYKSLAIELVFKKIGLEIKYYSVF